MAEEVHLVGSPLDLYLEECGGELAGSGQRLSLDVEAHDATEAESSKNRLPHVTSAEKLAKQMIDIFESVGLLSLDAPLREAHWSTLLEHAIVHGIGFLFGFGLLSGSLCIRRNRFLLNGYLQAFLWGGRGTLFFVTAFSMMRFWSESWQLCCHTYLLVEARRLTGIARSFWTDGSTIVAELIDCELFPVFSQGRQHLRRGSLVEAAYNIDIVIIKVFSSLHGRLGALVRTCVDRRFWQDNDLLFSERSKVGLRESLVQIWEFQTELLHRSIDLVLESNCTVALNLMRIVAAHISEAHVLLMQQVRLKRSLLIVHQTIGHLPFHGGQSFRETRIHATLRYVFALAGNSCVDVPLLVQDNGKMQRLADQLVPHIDTIKEMIKKKSRTPPQEAIDSLGKNASYQAESSAWHAIESSETQRVFEPQPKDVTFVHEAQGGLVNEEALEPKMRADMDMAFSENDSKQLLRGCLSELQEILALRCPAKLTSSKIAPHASEIESNPSGLDMKNQTIMKWETEGTGPDGSLAAGRPVRQRPVQRSQDTLHVLQALESCLQTRMHPRASASLEFEG